MIDTLLDTESLIIHLSCSLRAEAGDGEAGAGARKCAVFQNKAKCVVSCPPATAARQREGREGRRDSSDTLGTEPNL